MTRKIHPSALIDPAAEIATGVEVGPGVVIEAGVQVASGTTIGHNAWISGETIIGERCQIFPYAVVGVVPQDLKFKGESTRTVLGNDVVVREFASIHRGTAARGETVIGDGCLLMAYAHVAHDCILGEHVIIANATQLAGHIDIGDWAIIGGLTAIQQFVRIGAHAFVGGMTRIIKDVPPFVIVADIPTFAVGINIEGLRRRGFPSEVRTALQKAFHLIYRKGLTPVDAASHMRAEFPGLKEISLLAEFLEAAERGIMPGRAQLKESSREDDSSS
jgi:UDP-N-acetylglucosamine acyltransferase